MARSRPLSAAEPSWLREAGVYWWLSTQPRQPSSPFRFSGSASRHVDGGRDGKGAAALPAERVDSREARAGGDWLDFVLAVGEMGGVVELESR